MPDNNFNMGYGQFGWTNQTPFEFFGIQLNSNIQGKDQAQPNIPDRIDTFTQPLVQNPKELQEREKQFKKEKNLYNKFTNGLSEDQKVAIADWVGRSAQLGTQAVTNDMYFTEGGETANKIVTGLGQIKGLGPGVQLGQLGIDSIVRGLSSEMDTFDFDNQVAERMGGSYNFSNFNRAKQISGKHAFGKGKKEGQQILNEGNAQMETLSYIDKDNQSRQAMVANIQQNSMNYNNTLNGGVDFRYLRAAKLGVKLEYIDRLKSFRTPQVVNVDSKRVEEFKEGGTIEQFIPIITEPIEEWIPIITEPVVVFKEGGKTESDELVKLEETTQKNVIPEGALHKNKHHIENTEGLTQKGIPVIDNDGEQQAEIELDEIIFTLEVTKKLEELHKLYKEGNEDAATEAGKLLVQEILYNTDDRTGLIAKCEKGGKLNENVE